MQTFLDSVLDAIPDWGDHPGAYLFVLPSKRAGFFLKNKMAERTSRPLIAPRILSIESFIEEIAGISYSPNVDLIFQLYESYLEVQDEQQDSFHDFSKWGQTLLQDFNEIDRHLVDADALFKTLADLNEINQWTAGGETTPMIQRQLAFWKRLRPLYHHFRQALLEQGHGYQGMVYRKATETLQDFLPSLTERHIVFAGFNALNTAERHIIRTLLKEGRARSFWDADTHYLDNPIHDAGHFLRTYRSEWEELGGSLEGISSHLASPKEIRLVGLPKSVSQAKYCGELLDGLRLQSRDGIEKAAVVLADEGLLQPVLHSLPDSLGGVNVTMGYPIAKSPFARLFELLFELAATSAVRWPTARLLEVLSHSLLQRWFESLGFDQGGLRLKLLHENNLFCSRESLLKAGVPTGVLERILPKAEDLLPLPLTRFFLRLIETLRPSLATSGQQVQLEYLHRFHALFSRMETLGGHHSILSDVKGLYSLFRHLLEEERIDFQGEPLQGLQVMGMLESRNLDFETVILTSVNEGILPSGKSHGSFIPFDVKRAFGMPTYKEKDAVYTYHFYRLLQRAQRVFILYNTEPQVLDGAEPSRFIPQLLTDAVLEQWVHTEVASPVVRAMPAQMPEIPKSETLLRRLEEMGKKGFSPSSLAAFIEDPMRFYRKNVMRIADPVSLEETVAANTFGTVLHHAMETLYTPYVGQVLTPKDLEQLKQQSAKAVTRAYREHYLKAGEIAGRNLLALEVLKQYARRFLDAEKALAARHEIRILALEQEFRHLFPLPGMPGHSVYLRGLVDRIESVDDRIRIIDYKTGKVTPNQLRVDSWEAATTDKHTKALQLLCYAWMYGKKHQEFPIGAGVVSFKNLGVGRQWFGLKTGGRERKEWLDANDLLHFEAALGQLITRLFDPSVPLVEAGETP